MQLAPGERPRWVPSSTRAWDGLAVASLVAVDDETLRRFYAVLLKPEFPPADLMTYEELRDARLTATTRGTILLDVDNPVADIVTEDYLEGRVLLVAYLVVAATVRNGGIGRDCSAGLRRAARQPFWYSPRLRTRAASRRTTPATPSSGDRLHGRHDRRRSREPDTGTHEVPPRSAGARLHVEQLKRMRA
jgi:hypothetical protein